MKIKLDTTIRPAREVEGLVLGKALRLGPDKSGALVLTPGGEFLVVNKKGVRVQDPNEVLPALIIAARDECKLTQKELAAKTGVTENAVFSWENGRRNPSLLTVMSILWVCGIVEKWEGLESEP
jgi:DNA-binding XRE family transcriptional regulator